MLHAMRVRTPRCSKRKSILRAAENAPSRLRNAFCTNRVTSNVSRQRRLPAFKHTVSSSPRATGSESGCCALTTDENQTGQCEMSAIAANARSAGTATSMWSVQRTFIRVPPGGRSGGTTQGARSPAGRNRPSTSLLVMDGAKTLPATPRAPCVHEAEVIRVRVAALIVAQGRVLLARHAKNGRIAYLLPGGGVHDGETARAALARELREEASARVESHALRYVIETAAPDGSRHLLQLVFHATLLDEVGASTDPRVSACEWHDVVALKTLR